MKKIKVLSFAKFQAILLGSFGIIPGILYSFGGTAYDLYTTGSVNYGTLLAYIALIVMPIYFAVFGFILGIFEAIIYNYFSNKIITSGEGGALITNNKKIYEI